MSKNNKTIRTTISLKKSERDRLKEIARQSGLTVSYLLVSCTLEPHNIARFESRANFNIITTNITWDDVVTCCQTFTSSDSRNSIISILLRSDGSYKIDGNKGGLESLLKFTETIRVKGGLIIDMRIK